MLYTEKQIEEAGDAQKLKPDFARAYKIRGIAYHKKGLYDKAHSGHNQYLKRFFCLPILFREEPLKTRRNLK